MFSILGYKIIECINEGTKTIIYRAIRDIDNTSIIIKKPLSDYTDLPIISMSKHEYEINNKINSDKVVKIYDLEIINNIPILFEEDFGGSSLQNILKSKKLTLIEFFNIAIKITDALSSIHECSIVHNDINPSNIIVNLETNTVKITDFGLAAMLSKQNQCVLDSNFCGTLNYISPEQTGRLKCSIDYRSDLYSLGISFYEMVTGFLPFQSFDEITLIHSHLAIKPESPNKLNPLIPKMLSDIIMKLMEKSAENRYQSTLGLKYDLEKCINSLELDGTIKYFKLAQNDISERFQIANELFGRDDEIDFLLSAINRISNGTKEVVVVKGLSGVGKSSLIKEVLIPISKNQGRFISGKSEQFQHGNAHSALIQAFNSLVEQELTKSKDHIEILCKNLNKILGINGQILIDLIPEIERIIGKQPEVIELPTEETKNRFNLVFQNFIKFFCDATHPLVIFLDDMQWVDLTTLKLIETLIANYETGYLLLIMAYKDNEVLENHPLMLTINSIKREKIPISTILLEPLTLMATLEMVSKTLNCSLQEGIPLAELSYEKTKGNPLFLKQFLFSLYREDLIKFDNLNRVWEWDLYEIQNSGLATNIIELLIDRVLRLSPNAQELLKLASCIGTQFDIKTLSKVFGRSSMETYDILNEALTEDLILTNSDVFSFILHENDINLSYIFSHDKMQQSVYSLIEKKNKSELHLKIGRIMLTEITSSNEDDNILNIINQLNKGIHLLTDYNEKKTIAKLELKAGIKARKSNAYQLAYNCFEIGINLMEEKDWKDDYALTFSLYIEVSELAYLMGKYEALERYTEISLKHITNSIDKVNIYKVKIQCYIAQNRKREAINMTLVSLKLLRIRFSKNPSIFSIIFQLIKTRQILHKKTANDLLQLPTMTNETLILAMSSILRILMTTRIIYPKLFLLMVFKYFKLCLKHGLPSNSPVFHANYGMIKCNIGQVDSGYELGELALMLINKSNEKEFAVATIIIYTNFIGFRKKPARELLKPLIKAHLQGLETGDINFALEAAYMYSYTSYYAGKELSTLATEMSYYTEEMNNHNSKEWLYPHLIFHQAILNLLGTDKNTFNLSGRLYDESEMLPYHLSLGDRGTLWAIYLNKLMLCYIFGEFDKAIENASLARVYIDSAIGTFSIAVFYFYESLCLLLKFNTLQFIDQQKLLINVNLNQMKLKNLAKHAPMNFSHKYNLVEAEKARVLNKHLKAGDYYDKAIELATESEYLQEGALANELAGKFYMASGKVRKARTYLKEANYAYSLWGAVAKTKQLQLDYPFLNVNDTYKSRSMKAKNTPSETRLISSSMILDSATIIKATQAISGEIKLEELLKKLVFILLENAGAQKVYYLAKKDNEYIIQAAGLVNGNNLEIIQMPLPDSSSNIPKKIIYYVAHSKESIILDNAYKDEAYMNDPYILSEQCKSIMCMPVISKGDSIGILYLENNLISGAFNNERIEILKVISFQLAISLENAYLYNNLEELVEERTAELKNEICEREKVQKQLEEMATHDVLTGLSNRMLFQINLKNLIKTNNPKEDSFYVIFIDLDGFKAINDTLGHDSGDVVLKTVAKRLLKCVRSSDTVSRIGGDEFTIILDNIKLEKDVTSICNKIISQVRAPITLGETTGHVTASIGISNYPNDSEDADELIKKADDAMYIAKKSGKNRFIFKSKQ